LRFALPKSSYLFLSLVSVVIDFNTIAHKLRKVNRRKPILWEQEENPAKCCLLFRKRVLIFLYPPVYFGGRGWYTEKAIIKEREGFS
jgi:hypothetical protein